MAKSSAGLLLYRVRGGSPEVLLVHPGGPFWKNKDVGAWTIPKGEITEGEDAVAAARREFAEELGTPAEGEAVDLGSVKQKGGKMVHAWAVRGDLDVTAIKSNTFIMEWPPRSGKQTEFPEVDRAAFFDVPTARQKINPAQVAFLDKLQRILENKS